MKRCEDLSGADWLLSADTSPERLITFGPATFPSYGRLRYLPDPVRPGMAESEAIVPLGHQKDVDVARNVVRALATYSFSTKDCFVCLWEGYSGRLAEPSYGRGPLVTLPHRRYVLFTATIDELEGWEDLFGSAFNSPPAFIWPADHRWFFASDVDPHWAGIAADTSVISRLVADRSMDVVFADPGEDQPTYY